MSDGINQPEIVPSSDVWRDETDKYAAALAAFLKDFQNQLSHGDQTGLEIAGGSWENTQALWAGQLPHKVTALYQDGQIVQIHALYGEQAITDIYLSGPALKDFLAKFQDLVGDSIHDIDRDVRE